MIPDLTDDVRYYLRNFFSHLWWLACQWLQRCWLCHKTLNRDGLCVNCLCDRFKR